MVELIPIRGALTDRVRSIAESGAGQLFGALVFYATFDGLTRRAADLDLDGLEGEILLVGAAQRNWPWMLLLALVVGVAASRSPVRLFCRWVDLDNGSALRLVILPLLAVLTWQGALYDYNFVLDQTHVLDRILIVALASASWFRPAFLLAFVIEFRVIADQFGHPFGTTAAQNIDELLVIALLALVATHLMVVLTGRADTSPFLLILAAAVASHFFVPGRGKLDLGWLAVDQPGYLPRNGHVAGWLGQNDDSWARALADHASTWRPLILGGVLAVELGAVVAVLHHRLLRLWVPLAIVFHIGVFAATGFWFLGWILLELGLLGLLWSRRTRDWVRRTGTRGHAVVTFTAAVVLGSFLFHPPGLAWIDAPVGYGYEVEAVGPDGENWHVPISAFAPFEQELTFLRLPLGATGLATAGYGAVGAGPYDQLTSITNLTDLARYEADLDPSSSQASEAFIVDWVDHVNHRGSATWAPFSPPDHFWTGRPGPTLPAGARIERLTIVLVAAIHHDDHSELRRQEVLTIGIDDVGRAEVTSRHQG